MKSVREFVGRLRTIVDRANPEEPLSVNHRRIVVPEAGRFSFDGTILRTRPVNPVVPVDRPGGLTEVVQVLEWFDTPHDETSAAFRENDLGVDIAALLALATGRRVSFANEVPLRYEGINSTAFVEVGHSVDGELYGPVEAGVRDRFVNIAKAITALSEDSAVALGGAIQMRNAACCLVDSDHSSAYGLLVVALETLPRAFGDPPGTWGDWDQAEEWDRFFLDIALSGQQAEHIRQRLIIDKQIRLRRTFVEYAVGGLAPSFWERPYYRYTPGFTIDADSIRRTEGTWDVAEPLSVLLPQDEPELCRRLGRSYDARSEVFHQSARLDQIVVMPIPRGGRQPLAFAGLRRILDHLLWIEIAKCAADTPELPDFRVIHPVDLA